MKLTEVFDKYIEEMRLELKESTVETQIYRFNVIAKYIDDLDINDITYDMVKELQKNLFIRDGFSSSYDNHIISVLRKLFKYAYARKIIEFNPITEIKNVKDSTVKEKVIYDYKTYQDFSAVISNESDKLMFDFLFFLGLRIGELVALKWKNIDMINGIINIDSTATKSKGRQIITTPKTNSSIRKIVCNTTLLEKIKEYYLIVKATYPKTNELFVFGNIKMIPFTTLSRRLDKYLKLAGTPKITFHGFRHSHATMLNSLTGDLKAISARLGHDSIETTMKVYIHSNLRSQQILAELIEKEINEKDQFNSYSQFIKNIKDTLLNAMSSDKFSAKENKNIIDIYQYIINLDM